MDILEELYRERLEKEKKSKGELADTGESEKESSEEKEDNRVVGESSSGDLVDSLLDEFEEKRIWEERHLDSEKSSGEFGRGVIFSELGSEVEIEKREKKKKGYWKTKEYSKLANPKKRDKILDRVEMVGAEIEANKSGFEIWEQNRIGKRKVEEEVEKSEASKVKVTGAGTTLEEFLRRRRRVKRGAKPISDYKKLAEKIIEESPKKIDTRYQKTALKDRKRKVKTNAKLRKKKSMYLLKNTGISEAQRIIYRNLNLTRREMDLLLARGGLSAYEMDEMVARGRETEYSQFVKRSDIKYINNYDILLFLKKFRWATAKIIQNMYRNRSLAAVKRMLLVLENSGFVNKSFLPGGNPVYSLTTAGSAAIGDEKHILINPLPNTLQIPPLFGANFIAACLWNRSYNILDEDESTWRKGFVRWGVTKDGEWKWLPGEVLISEYEIRSAFQKKKWRVAEGKVAGKSEYLRQWFINDYRMSFQDWEMSGKKGTSPEEEKGREYLYAIVSNYEDTSRLHFPDLVVKRPRNADGSPNTIAIEFERSPNSTKLASVFNSYRREQWIYKEVIWIVFDDKAAKMIERAAKKVGISPDRYRIIPLIGPRGVITDSNMFLM